jgi:hypothetical protein
MRNFEQPCEWTRDQCWRDSWPQLASAMTDPMDNKQREFNNENSF